MTLCCEMAMPTFIFADSSTQSTAAHEKVRMSSPLDSATATGQAPVRAAGSTRRPEPVLHVYVVTSVCSRCEYGTRARRHAYGFARTSLLGCVRRGDPSMRVIPPLDNLSPDIRATQCRRMDTSGSLDNVRPTSSFNCMNHGVSTMTSTKWHPVSLMRLKNCVNFGASTTTSTIFASLKR